MRGKSGGFTLIEVVVSGALVATAVGALLASSSLVVRLSSQSQNRLIAAHLARDGIEMVRHIRHTNVVANPCPNNSECARVWTDGILDRSETLPLTRPLVKRVVRVGDVASLETVSSSQQACGEVFARHTGRGTGHLEPIADLRFGEDQQMFCRRIVIESVDDPSLRGETLRVRSQVAWLKDGPSAFRSLGDVVAQPQCASQPETQSEWCTEQVTLLTSWRTGE